MSRKYTDILQLVVGIVVLILLNYLGSFFFSRIDLTSDKRYSLSEVSLEQAQELDDFVYVRVYLDGDLPADYKKLREATQELLDEFRAYTGDNLQYEFIDPSANPNEEERERVYNKLVKEGLKPTTLRKESVEEASQKVIFAGAMVTYKDRTLPWQLLRTQLGVPEPLMINNSIQQLEYEFSSILRNLMTVNKKRVAILQGHGELDEASMADIKKSLLEFYAVEEVTLNHQLRALEGYDAVIVAGPDSAFDEKNKFILDQFVMYGGKALWLVEPVSITMDSLQSASTTLALPRDLNLDDQFFRYGVRINRDLVMDMQSMPIPVVTGQIGNQPRQELFPWFYFPMIIPGKQHAIVKNLDAIKSEFISTIDFVGKDTAIKKTVLLTSSDYSKVVSTPNRVSLNILRMEPDPRQFNLGPQPLAVLVEGKFTSNFKNRLVDKIAQNQGIAFRESSYPTKQIFVADADIIRNRVNRNTNEFYALGFDRYTRRIYANKDFIMNCMNYLLDDSGLLNVRAKEFKMRLLDRPRIEKQKFSWQLVNTVVPVLIILLYGLISYYWRRRKYTRR
ncbi:gliding motility-associated ABC transporter substrate-binding protein GldG [bacterium SCSIO 12741]|nr:gliding motility-associated ABC transporter substrate-binding protein GldG [bacterium SCSIO 12741]